MLSSIRSIGPVRAAVTCQGDHGGCCRRAEYRITWRTPEMAAPAFYYVCEPCFRAALPEGRVEFEPVQEEA